MKVIVSKSEDTDHTGEPTESIILAYFLGFSERTLTCSTQV